MRATAFPAEQGCYDDHRFIDLMMDLSSRFAGADHREVDTQIKDALERIVEFFDADRGMLYKVLRNEGVITVSERVEKGAEKSIPWLLNARGEFPWLYEEIVVRHKTVYIPSIDALPIEAAQDRMGLLAWGTRSALLIPLSLPGSADLILALGCRRDHPDWPECLISRLRLLGETLARVLRRKELEEEKTEALQFEQLITRTSADLAATEPDQACRLIEQALQAVLDYTQNDQAGFFTVFAETGQVYLSHLRHVSGISGSPSRSTMRHSAHGCTRPL